ncbi:hypothetical protein FHT86_004787 [Rhizobium sp. BK313]|jgi:nitrile hydratase|uniref:hypothetical protein n=1 Tax=Rhizobium sp. BK313 TaxID=2587081 RepID=UPI0010F41CA0|nr:hypothetical protein [Rhizobium sp. BK313]MBB3456479.1 hypothetical protein [Rhizobium sp. BK313]
MTEHEHHDHAPVVANDPPGYYDVMETAFQKLMIEKGYFTAGRAKPSCSDRIMRRGS